MALPSYADIELPLLLELERHGGRIQRLIEYPAFCQAVSKHLPALTANDMKQLRKTGELVWPNMIAWARNNLKKMRQLNGDRPGMWEITPEGKQRLRSNLKRLGLDSEEEFIRSDYSISEAAGARWQPKPLRSMKSEPPPAPAPAPDDGQVTTQGRDPSIAVTPGFPPTPAPIETERPSSDALMIDDELKAHLHSLAPSQFEGPGCRISEIQRTL
ncbi:MAG: hypothetical protein BZY75_04720 [SAR202 cluster bacterium Io17-Chloro-G7]|nr:MAG: hypothetical protein BZY75_04720 [SAR202 cluster bacterium Io17-Chloro-G7]